MEWLDGETLAQRLFRAGLSLCESLQCLRAITSALAEAHGRGIVHRDLEAPNRR